MSKNNNRATVDEIETLKKAVEQFVNRRIATPSDFDYLVDCIHERIKQSVSSTTLKRVWGYINDAGNSYQPGRYTLCTLARFIGYRDFEDFSASLPDVSISQSQTYSGPVIVSRDLAPGTLIMLKWSPNRTVMLRHIDAANYLVISSSNARLQSGDVVTCDAFTDFAPAFFSQVVRADQAPFTYVAGSRTGIRLSLLDSDTISQ